MHEGDSKVLKCPYLHAAFSTLSSAEGEAGPPPPPVSWGHVTGLQPTLLGHLKGFVKSLDNPVQKDNSLVLIPAYLVYLGAYYHHLSVQVLSPASPCLHVQETVHLKSITKPHFSFL